MIIIILVFGWLGDGWVVELVGSWEHGIEPGLKDRLA